jgi:outer membrane protein assembly factor BamB
MMNFRFKCVALMCMAVGLIACSSTDKRSPAELPALTHPLSISESWVTKIGAVGFPLQVASAGNHLALASSEGSVAVIDGLSGRDVWRLNVESSITAGVGYDGVTASVVTSANELVAMRNGKIQWKQRLSGRGYTAPLVAGGRVFALSADRSITAYDGDSGRRLWVSNKGGNEALVLQNAGVLVAIGDTLVAGVSGRLIGMLPSNGSTVWDVALGFVRGGNDVERLIDVIGPAARAGSSVCVRAFQLAMGCVDTQRRLLAWSNPGKGTTGLGGDGAAVFASESDGKIIAMQRSDGAKIWTNEKLTYRELSAPASNGRFVVLGDGAGYVHWMDRNTGELVGRVQADKSPVISQPMLFGNQVVVITKSGVVSSYLVN